MAIVVGSVPGPSPGNTKDPGEPGATDNRVGTIAGEFVTDPMVGVAVEMAARFCNVAVAMGFRFVAGKGVYQLSEDKEKRVGTGGALVGVSVSTGKMTSIPSVGVGVSVASPVGLGAGVSVGIGVALLVGLAVAGLTVLVLVAVGWLVEVAVGNGVPVLVGAFVLVTVGVVDGVGAGFVGVGVADGGRTACVAVAVADGGGTDCFVAVGVADDGGTACVAVAVAVAVAMAAAVLVAACV